MKIHIDKEKINELLKRKEIVATADDLTKTPTRKDIVAQLAAVTGNDQNRISIDSIKEKFGGNKATIIAKIYETEKDRNAIEAKYKLNRKSKKKDEPKEETKPAEEKTGE